MKTFKYEQCKKCWNTYNISPECKDCIDGNKLDEIWQGDENCIHKQKSSSGGGIHCHKCGGWTCF